MSRLASQFIQASPSLRLNREGAPLPLPPALLHLERSPRSLPAHFGRFRVGMVLFQLDQPRHQWRQEAPWRAPERTIRTSSLIRQLLLQCEAAGWTYDLLAFPAGCLNYYAPDGALTSVLESAEVLQILSTLRRVRRSIYAIAFGVNTYAEEENRLREGERLEPATGQALVAADTTGTPFVYHHPMPRREIDSVGSGVVTTLAGRKVCLSLEEEGFDRLIHQQDALFRPKKVDLWLNPIQINHPGGGPSPGSWPVKRVANALHGMTYPIFLPHFRRTRLEGPFWFAGHPIECRSHRWQPRAETWFQSRDGRIQLLTFDLNL